MPENEFEHRVQQKMDEFHLRPSAQVWEEVEKRIRKQKRRRIIFWWFILPVFLAAGITAGWWLMQPQGRQNTVAQQQTTHTANNSSNNTTIQRNEPSAANEKKLSTVPAEENTGAVASVAAGDTRNTADVAIKKPGSEPLITPVTTPGSLTRKNGTTSSERADRHNKNMPVKDEPVQLAIRTAGGQKKGKQKQKSDTNPVAAKENISQAEIKTEPGLTQQASVNNIEPAKDSALLVAKTTTETQQTSTPELPAEKNKPVNPADSLNKETTSIIKKPVKKNVWELSVHAGTSSLVSGFGSFKSNFMADAAQPLGGAPALTARPSPTRKGLSAGIFLYRLKNSSPRLQIGAGVGYNYLSTRITVGQLVDSSRNVTNSLSTNTAVSKFFRPAGASGVRREYTNQYHFITLAATMNWTMINGAKFKMQWKNELQYRLLVSSGMLHYDYGLPGYYKDNSLLRKGNLFLQSGLSVPAGKRLQFNPGFAYGITPVLKSGGASAHYAEATLRISFLLRK